jgi:hypothetical protein
MAKTKNGSTKADKAKESKTKADKAKESKTKADKAKAGDVKILAAVVINKRTAPHSISHTFNTKEPSASTNLLILVPGVNYLRGEQVRVWEAERETPDIAAMLERRDLIVAKDAQGADLVELPRSLADLDLVMASELVQSTTQTETLQGWLGNEGRKEIRKVITDQIDIMKDFERRAEDARKVGAA